MHNEPKGRGTCSIIQIVEIPHIRGEEEEVYSKPTIEEPFSPTQTRSCVKSMTPCASPQSEPTIEYLSKPLIVSKGGHSSSNQSNGSSVHS
jgi:hypothetical protein